MWTCEEDNGGRKVIHDKVHAGGMDSPRQGTPLAVPVFSPKQQPCPIRVADNKSLILFGNGEEVVVRAGERGVRFLIVSGTPIGEPVAWRGPIVMNTSEELQQAYAELRDGTFIKR